MVQWNINQAAACYQDNGCPEGMELPNIGILRDTCPRVRWGYGWGTFHMIVAYTHVTLLFLLNLGILIQTFQEEKKLEEIEVTKKEIHQLVQYGILCSAKPHLMRAVRHELRLAHDRLQKITNNVLQHTLFERHHAPKGVQ